MIPTGSLEPKVADESYRADQENLHHLLAGFEVVTLAEMSSANLLERSELKFVLPQTLLLPVLSELTDSYRVLVVAGQLLSHYRTLYFDTEDLAMYRRHHAGAPARYKVRAREYVDSSAAFLEVKHKTGAQHTVKKRIPTAAPLAALPSHAAAFLAETCPYPADTLHASLWNHYTRITLVSKYRPERVTLDMGLTFTHEAGRAALPGIVVAEVKYVADQHGSEFVRLMRHCRVHGTSFSKYCMGVSLLYPDVKHNRFKAKQRLVERLAGVNTKPIESYLLNS